MTSQSISILIGVLLLFPVLVVALGELSLRLRRRGLAYASSVDLARNAVLPIAAVYLLFVYVAKVPQGSLATKLFVTFGVIIGLVALLGILNGILFERDAGSKVPKLFLDLGRILVIFFGIALVLSLVWGYDLNNLITALGVSSIVLGLALQDTLGNLFNGITLINERPFKVGDYIEVEEHAGKVIEVNWRAVRLLTRERDMIVLPHIKVSQSAIINHSQPEEYWAEKIILGFSYDHPPNQVKRVLLETCLATPFILHEPEPEVKVDDFADSAVMYEVEYYIRSYGDREEIRDDFMSRVWYAARRNGFSIPFPQLNIHREPQGDKDRADARNRQRQLEFACRLLGIGEERDHLLSARSIELLSFGEGESMMNQGSSAPGLFLILSGRMQVITRDLEGVSHKLGTLRRGDLVTEVLPSGSRVNAASVRAETDTEALHFSEKTIRRLVNRNPALANQLNEVVESRRRQINKIANEVSQKK